MDTEKKTKPKKKTKHKNKPWPLRNPSQLVDHSQTDA